MTRNNDILSRGCTPKKRIKSRWWEGPYWLRDDPEKWPLGEIDSQPGEVGIERKMVANVDLSENAPVWILNDMSSYDKLIRVFAWVKRVRYRAKLFRDLRQRFRKEYLSQLIQKVNRKSTRGPKVGEIVLHGRRGQ